MVNRTTIDENEKLRPFYNYRRPLNSAQLAFERRAREVEQELVLAPKDKPQTIDAVVAPHRSIVETTYRVPSSRLSRGLLEVGAGLLLLGASQHSVSHYTPNVTPTTFNQTKSYSSGK